MEYEKIKRANLIEFLPVKEGDKVLYVDNLKEGLKQNGTYDWIFVLPYEEKEKGGFYIGKLLTMLTDKGRLYLAAENPFSLHKLAGETEEDGSVLQAFLPKGFEKSKGLSLSMLKVQAEEAIRQCSEAYSIKVYYPYPNIHFPSAVYTDGYLPKSGECDENYYNFNHARFGFFDEMQATEEVVKAGMYPELANGYLLEIAKENTDILYCRYSVERDKDKKIYTSISQNKNGEKVVKKAAYETEANEHIKKLDIWEKKLTKQLANATFLQKKISVNRIIEKNQLNGKEQVSFAYVKGQTLENYLDELLKGGQFEVCKEVLLDFCRTIEGLGNQVPFQITEEFRKVFGLVDDNRLCNMMSLSITDIDMVCQNIILGDEITLIDYEWTFDFKVPVKYLIYRVLFLYLEQKGRRKSPCFHNQFDFYKEMGITPEEKKLFEQMEIQFQKYAQGDCKLLRDVYLKEGKPVVPMAALMEQLHKAGENFIRIQYDTGQGFLEENSHKRVLSQDEKGIFSLVLDFREDLHIHGIKLAFSQPQTMIRIGLLQEDETESTEVLYETNGTAINPILYVYKEKPYLITKNLKPEAKRLYISLQIIELPESFVEETTRAVSDMKAVIANREEQIANYENSTSWKLTKPLREFGRKK